MYMCFLPLELSDFQPQLRHLLPGDSEVFNLHAIHLRRVNLPRLADTAPAGLRSGSGRWSQEARQKFQSDLEAAQAAKRRARQEKRQNNMAEYDTANEEDVNPKMDFRLEFNQEDPELWFATLECNMQTRGIKSQLSKKAVLVANLPAKVQTVCRPCLTNPSRDTPYKELKTRILKHYGPKDIRGDDTRDRRTLRRPRSGFLLLRVLRVKNKPAS